MVKKRIRTKCILGLVFLVFLSASAFKVKDKEQLLKGNFFWHWHRNDSLSRANIEELTKFNIKGIFFHMGEFTFYKNEPQFRGFKFRDKIFEEMAGLNNLQAHLVFTFANSSKNPFVKYFNEYNQDAMTYIMETIDSYLNIFRCNGINISGIQLDMEGKIDIEKYKNLIDELAKKLGREYLLSITPQANWYKREKFDALIENVDFVVPMFYDYDVGNTVKSRMKVTDTGWIKNMVKKYGEVNKPFYAGIPTYSYSKIYNEKGKRIEPWAKLSIESMSEEPDFSLIKSENYDGDNIYMFEAERDTELVNYQLKKGAVVKFNLVTPEAVDNYIKGINKVKPDNLLGVAFFRYGYPEEKLVIGTQEIADVLGNVISIGCVPQVDIVMDEEEYVYLNVGDTIKINLVLINTGAQNSYVSDRANQLELKVENGKIEKAYIGDFDNLKESENTLVLNERHLSKKEAVYSGLITIKIEKTPLILKIKGKSMQENGKKYVVSAEKIIKISTNKVEINEGTTKEK